MQKKLVILLTLSLTCAIFSGCDGFDESDKIYVTKNGDTAETSCLVRRQDPEDKLCPMTPEYDGMFCVNDKTFKKILKKLGEESSIYSANVQVLNMILLDIVNENR